MQWFSVWLPSLAENHCCEGLEGPLGPELVPSWFGGLIWLIWISRQHPLPPCHFMGIYALKINRTTPLLSRIVNSHAPLLESPEKLSLCFFKSSYRDEVSVLPWETETYMYVRHKCTWSPHGVINEVGTSIGWNSPGELERYEFSIWSEVRDDNLLAAERGGHFATRSNMNFRSLGVLCWRRGWRLVHGYIGWGQKGHLVKGFILQGWNLSRFDSKGRDPAWSVFQVEMQK